MISSYVVAIAIAIAIVMFLMLPLHSAFSQRSIVHAQSQAHHLVVGKLCATLPGDPCITASDTNFLGPPKVLSSLQIEETYYHPLQSKNITRLSTQPDIFLIRNYIASSNDRETLMDMAITQGMKIAGTRESKVNTVRKNSYLAWIDPHSFYSNKRDKDAISIVREIIAKSRQYFAHDVMNYLMDNVEKIDYAVAEEMQVAKYDSNGHFNYHHDGYGRYLTVISYLNGIGGTYFPFGNMGCKLKEDGIDFTTEDLVSVMAFKKTVDKCGILIAGKEGANAYTSSSSLNPKTIIDIQAGDAIAFYSYAPNGDKDQRSVHCSLAVPEEKWISTCWFRSVALTGPSRAMKIARMEDELMTGAANSFGIIDRS